jgi:hypothetical protein
MKIIAMTGVAVALLTMPAYAQQTPPYMSLPSGKEAKPAEEHAPVKADEKAYKSALDAIPKPKQAYDPWHNVREKPQPK